jgi:hypothetical protein
MRERSVLLTTFIFGALVGALTGFLINGLLASVGTAAFVGLAALLGAYLMRKALPRSAAQRDIDAHRGEGS